MDKWYRDAWVWVSSVLIMNVMVFLVARSYHQSLGHVTQLIADLNSMLLVVLALFGLQQIAVSKEQHLEEKQHNAEEKRRSQIAESARQAEEFRKILELDLRFAKAVKKAKSTLYRGPTELVNISSIPDHPLWDIWDAEFVDDARLRISRSHYDKGLGFLNHLEAFSLAVYHMAEHGLLDEDALFSAAGDTFVSTVNQTYDVLCATRARDHFMLYSNVVRLYTRWEGRVINSHIEHLTRLDAGGWIRKFGALNVLVRDADGELCNLDEIGDLRDLIYEDITSDFVPGIKVYVQAVDPQGNPLPAWPVEIKHIEGDRGARVYVQGYREGNLIRQSVSSYTTEIRTNSSGTVVVHYFPRPDSADHPTTDQIEITITRPTEPNEQMYSCRLQYTNRPPSSSPTSD